MDDPWRYRRRFMTSICGFCAVSIWTIILFRADSQVANTVVTMAFGILGTSLTSYVFGAAWENKSKKE